MIFFVTFAPNHYTLKIKSDEWLVNTDKITVPLPISVS